MRIGFLGLGAMGSPMALRLLAAGHELSVWNRTEERAKPAIHEGAIAAATPAEAELGADALVTVLRDDAAYEEVFFGIYRLIDALSPGLLHILCANLSAALAERLALEHARRAVDLVFVNLRGSPREAESGTLHLSIAGTRPAVDRAMPILALFSSHIAYAGDDPAPAFGNPRA